MEPPTEKVRKWITVERGWPERFGIDTEGIRRGLYSDQYFNNAEKILTQLAEEKYRYGGAERPPELLQRDLTDVAVGDMEADLQIFTRRQPFTVLSGVKPALAVIGACAGSLGESGRFEPAVHRLRVRAVRDGGRLMPWEAAMRIAGRYRDFASLETVLLGILTRASLIATNTYQMLEATGGKPVFFFPARFDLYCTQAFDGMAFKTGVDVYNREHKADVPPLISTDAQGAFWGSRGTGTVSHSFLLCFLKDTTEAVLQFARCTPPEVKRIALVDVNNDCVGDSRRVALAMFEQHRKRLKEGDGEEARKYELFGVRLDTSGNMRDISIEPTGEPNLDNGVCPRLVRQVREMLDSLADDPSLESGDRDAAREYFKNVKIVVSGGFTPERVALFRDMGIPADLYGVGSWFFRGGANDFTADLVRLKIGDAWVNLAKTGRRAFENDNLRDVRFPG